MSQTIGILPQSIAAEAEIFGRHAQGQFATVAAILHGSPFSPSRMWQIECARQARLAICQRLQRCTRGWKKSYPVLPVSLAVTAQFS